MIHEDLKPNPLEWNGSHTWRIFAVHYATHPLGETSKYVVNSLWIPSHSLGYVATLLILFGFVGLYARQAEKVGRLGLIGFVLAVVGDVTLGGALLVGSAIVAPWLVANLTALTDSWLSLPSFLAIAGLGDALFLVGYILFQVATIRAKVLPNWTRWLVIMSVLGLLIAVGGGGLLGGLATQQGVLVGDIGFIVLSPSFVGWGYVLWLEKGQIPMQS